MLSPNERELLHVLFDDINIVKGRLQLGLPQPHDLRAVFSPILRRWLGEGQVHQVQRLIRSHRIGFPLIGQATEINLCTSGFFEHWMGMLIIDSIGIGVGQRAAAYLQAPEPVRSNHIAVPQPAKHFIDQKLFYWKGHFYTRRDLILWLANRFGGTHLDFKRKDDEKHIDEIRNYFGLEITGSNRQILIGEQVAAGRADSQRRHKVYDAAELTVWDTARIFAEGISASETVMRALLDEVG